MRWLKRWWWLKTKFRWVVCDCGTVLSVDTRICLTSFPCQHAAACSRCNKNYTVYGLGNHSGFTRDRDLAINW
jgi:hypothetical protein